MGSEWVESVLSDSINIKHGFAFKGEFFKAEETKDYLLTPGNFAIGGGFKGGKFKYYDGPVLDDYVLKYDDLVVTMTDLSKEADTLGYSALVPEIAGHRLLHNQRVGLVEFKNDSLDKYFLYFLLRSPSYRHHVVSGVTGTTVKHTSPTKILSYEFKKPPISEQVLIGKHLLAIEKKIQLNRQTNQTLEQMAQALFKSWFVDFDPVIDNALLAGNEIPEPLRNRAEIRKALLGSQEGAQEEPDQLRALFPSEFEHTELSNSAANAGGWVPKGWKTGPLSSIASLINKAAHPNKEPDKEWIHFSIPAFDENLRPAIDLGANIKSGKYWVPDSSILVSKLNPETKRIWVPKLSDEESSVCSTEFMPFVPKKDDNLSFLYSLICDEGTQKEICNRATGSTGSRQRVKPKEIEAMELLLPTTDLIEHFSKLTTAWLRKQQDLVDENQSLEKLRDTLLPKLISGELRLPDFESAPDEINSAEATA